MTTEDTWPPRTVPPENRRLSGQFDRLVSTNLLLSKAIMIAIPVMIALTFVAVCISAHSALAVRELAQMMIQILERSACK